MKNDEFKIGEDFEERPGTSTLKEDTSFVATVIVVVIAIIVGLIVFFVINFMVRPKQESTEQSLSLDNENVKALYSYVTYGTNNNRFDTFVKSDTNINTFSSVEKLSYALMFAKESDFVSTSRVDSNNNKIYSIKNSKIKEYMETFFGPNVVYSSVSELKYYFDFYINGKNYAIMTYNSSNNGYDTVFVDSENNSNFNVIEPFYTKLESAKSYDNGILELKEKIIYVDYTSKDNTFTINIYKDFQHTKLIDTLNVQINVPDISVNDYITNASTITYRFATNSKTNTYYFLESHIDN